MNDAKADYDLAVLSLAGDIQAWDQLYNISNKIVTGYVRKHLRLFNLGIVSDEDITSEAYARAYEKLHTFKGDSRFSTWVCGIAKYIILEENRKHNHREQIYQEYIRLQLTFYSQDPCDIILEAELYRSLWSAFEKLQPFEAYILESCIIYGYKFSKLGKVTCLPTRIVEKYYQSALDRYSIFFHATHHRRV